MVERIPKTHLIPIVGVSLDSIAEMGGRPSYQRLCNKEDLGERFRGAFFIPYQLVSTALAVYGIYEAIDALF